MALPHACHACQPHAARRRLQALDFRSPAILRCTGLARPQALAWAASGDPLLLSDLEQLFADAATLGLRVGRVWANANGRKVRPPFLDEFDRQLIPANVSEGGRHAAAAGGLPTTRQLVGRGECPLAFTSCCPPVARPQSLCPRRCLSLPGSRCSRSPEC